MLRSQSRVIHVAAMCSLLIPIAAAQQAEPVSRRIQTHYQRAREAFQANRPDLAKTEFLAILAIDAKQVEARASLGMIAFLGADFAEAATHFRAAVQLQPALWRAHALLGMSLRRTGDLSGSRAALEKAFPNLRDDPNLKVKSAMELVDIYHQSGDLGKAAGVIAEALQINPSDTDILYAAYHTYSKLAGQALDSMVAAGPQSARMRQVIAQRRAEAGDVKAALEHYRQALELNPQLPGARFEYGQALLLEGSEDSLLLARKEFESALAANPNDPDAERQLGEVFLRLSDHSAAAAHFSRALQLRPGDAGAHFGVGKIHADNGELEKAASHFESAIRLDPDHALAHYRLGSVYQRQGRPADADREIASFQQLRAAQRKSVDLYRALGRQPKRDTPDDGQQ